MKIAAITTALVMLPIAAQAGSTSASKNADKHTGQYHFLMEIAPASGNAVGIEEIAIAHEGLTFQKATSRSGKMPRRNNQNN